MRLESPGGCLDAVVPDRSRSRRAAVAGHCAPDPLLDLGVDYAALRRVGDEASNEVAPDVARVQPDSMGCAPSSIVIVPAGRPSGTASSSAESPPARRGLCSGWFHHERDANGREHSVYGPSSRPFDRRTPALGPTSIDTPQHSAEHRGFTVPTTDATGPARRPAANSNAPLAPARVTLPDADHGVTTCGRGRLKARRARRGASKDGLHPFSFAAARAAALQGQDSATGVATT